MRLRHHQFNLDTLNVLTRINRVISREQYYKKPTEYATRPNSRAKTQDVTHKNLINTL